MQSNEVFLILFRDDNDMEDEATSTETDAEADSEGELEKEKSTIAVVEYLHDFWILFNSDLLIYVLMQFRNDTFWQGHKILVAHMVKNYDVYNISSVIHF